MTRRSFLKTFALAAFSSMMTFASSPSLRPFLIWRDVGGKWIVKDVGSSIRDGADFATGACAIEGFDGGTVFDCSGLDCCRPEGVGVEMVMSCSLPDVTS